MLLIKFLCFFDAPLFSLKLITISYGFDMLRSVVVVVSVDSWRVENSEPSFNRVRIVLVVLLELLQVASDVDFFKCGRHVLAEVLLHGNGRRVQCILDQAHLV